jgi:hypothetical protein
MVPLFNGSYLHAQWCVLFSICSQLSREMETGEETLLPDGRIFGQITQNPKTKAIAQETFVAGKLHNLAKGGRNEARKYFCNFQVGTRIPVHLHVGNVYR